MTHPGHKPVSSDRQVAMSLEVLSGSSLDRFTDKR
jgi:hypothetical protein